MRFEFFGILKQMAGSPLQVEQEKPVQLRDLLGPLSTRLGEFVPYGCETTEAQLLSNLSFVRDGRMLRMKDRIDKGDTILVILPATGG